MPSEAVEAQAVYTLSGGILGTLKTGARGLGRTALNAPDHNRGLPRTARGPEKEGKCDAKNVGYRWSQ
ncbi:MAG: hypothetical protein DMG25_07890 [Acidobacteria bacterium]|nr:MAG: hypothetical protein DMG25_07890 [Acidobacteriota bacterium]PYV24890.1 MAG: hypothetical protein DMG27_11740 [Acidobacteriota bacterium]